MKKHCALIRFFSFLTCALIVLPACSLMTAHAAAQELPANTAYVDASLSAGDAAFTFRGTEYTATVGINAFRTLSEALASVEAGGTLWLAPGTYSEGLVINKDVTILGPKAGIDPNVKGANPDDDWTRSPERGTGEAVLTTSWHMGINANTKEVYDCHNITVDGIAVSGAGMFRSNYGASGSITINYKNILVSGYTTNGNGPFYCYSYYPDRATNKYVRTINAENIRFEGQSTAPGFNLTVEHFNAKGIYFDGKSTNKCIPLVTLPEASASSGFATITVTDSMFRQKINQVLNINLTASSGGHNFNATLKNYQKVTVHIENNVFFNNDSAAAANNNIIVPQIDKENVYFEIVNNRFVQSNAADNYIAIHGATSALPLGEKFTVTGNVFIGIPTALNIPSSTTPFVLDGNYFEDANGNPAKPVTPNANNTTWWYLDPAKTRTSTELADVLDGVITSGTVDAAAHTVKAQASGDSFTFTMKTEAYNTLRVYADRELTQELGSTVHLYKAENTFYLKVSTMTGKTSEIYTATVTTSAPDALGYDIASEVKLLGRTYAENGRFFFNWSASGFSFNFKGSGASATILSTASGSGNAFIKIYVDGVEMRDVELTAKEMTIELARDLDPTVAHNVTVLKRTNGRSSYAAVSDIRLKDGEKLAPPAPAARRIEFIGDSLTVGYATVAGSATAWSTATEDVTKTYVKAIADAFGADYSVVAISGRGVVRNTDGTTDRLLPAIYGNLDEYNIPGTPYSFANQPDVIVINLGTNDASSNNPNLTNAEFKAGALAFLRDVRAKNPNAEIIWAYGLTTVKFAAQMKEAVDQLRAEGDTHVNFLQLATCTAAEKTLGHPKEEGYAKSITALTELISTLTGWKTGADEPETTGEETTAAPTVSDTAAEENTSGAETTAPADSGCGSTVSAAAACAAAAAAAGCAILTHKKKED